MDLRKLCPRLLDKIRGLLDVKSQIIHLLADLQVAHLLAGQAGFEPATLGFGVRCSGQLELLTLPGDYVPLNILNDATELMI
jgi:hypothetical protein